MLLVFDIGNSDITIGLWHEEQWLHVWRTPSRTDQPELFYGIKIRDFFLEAHLATEEVHAIVISSVVPGLTPTIQAVVATIFSPPPLMIGPAVYQKLPITVLNPYEIGADLVANAVAAFDRYRQQCIVVDFGTALTFTTLSSSGVILGVSMVPGLRTAVRSLGQFTAKLFDVPLEMPTSALGTNTVTAIQSGILNGYEGLVRGVVAKIKAELSGECLVVATGGLSSVIQPLKDLFYEIEPLMTLDGLRIIHQWVNAT